MTRLAADFTPHSKSDGQKKTNDTVTDTFERQKKNQQEGQTDGHPDLTHRDEDL